MAIPYSILLFSASKSLQREKSLRFQSSKREDAHDMEIFIRTRVRSTVYRKVDFIVAIINVTFAFVFALRNVLSQLKGAPGVSFDESLSLSLALLILLRDA